MRFVCLVPLLASALLVSFSSTFPQRPTAETVILRLNIEDEKKQLTTRLNKEQLALNIDNQAAEIRELVVDDGAASVGILVDASSSMGRESTERSKVPGDDLVKAITSFLQASNPHNEYFLMGFNQQPQLLVDWTSDEKVLLAAVRRIAPNTSTALNDACYVALSKLRNSHNEKRALIIISDGQDNASRYTFAELVELLKQEAPVVFAIDFPRPYTGASRELAGHGALEELASVSGGRAYFFRGGQRKMDRVLESLRDMADRLNNQLKLTLSVQHGSNQWHTVTIKSRRNSDEKLKFRVRKGFYL
jgi:Ca-activated chloride channel family protein